MDRRVGCFVLIESEGTRKIFICYHEIFGLQSFQIVQYISEHDTNCYRGIVRHWTDHFFSLPLRSVFLLILVLFESQTTTIPSLSYSLTSRVYQKRYKTGVWVKENIQGILASLSLLHMLSRGVAVSPLCFHQRTTSSLIFVSVRKTYHSYSLIQWSWVLDLVTCFPRYEPLRCGNDFLFFLKSCLHHYILPSRFTCRTNFLCCISGVWNI